MKYLVLCHLAMDAEELSLESTVDCQIPTL